MGPVARSRTRSIFSPATDRERAENFESYWIYVQRKNGQILEDAKDLTEKQRALVRFQERAVRSRKPLSESFDRNYDTMQDDPQSLDRRTLLLTFLYKFARHEWVGISAAWDVTPTMAQGVRLIDKISRYHLAEEFCHMRLFHEMFQTFRLEGVEWGPLPKRTKQLYGAFSRLPGALVAPPAFVSELMGLTVYLHTDKMLDEILADEPEVRDRVRALLREIMTDELAHVGERRNFIGPIGLRMAKLMVKPMFRAFFGGIPESTLLFDIPRMMKEAEAFDYSTIAPETLSASWVPSYCWSRP
ncbi:MAG: hypothetical protein DMD96_16405 [Candidatus Rokuibacteriota bacterium]|nr:MAG: hypothetical protein DMD96_16405 [Candidatus Rokubacteria bacterium]